MEMTEHNTSKNLGKIIKRQRIAIPLTLKELSARSDVSSSHLGRVEGESAFHQPIFCKESPSP